MVVLKFVESLQNLFIQTFINRNYHKYLAIRSMSVFFDHFTGHGRAKYCFSYFQNQWVTTVLMICDMLIFKQIQFTTWLSSRLFFCSWPKDVSMKTRYYFIVILVFSTNINQYIAISPTCSILVLFDHL